MPLLFAAASLLGIGWLLVRAGESAGSSGESREALDIEAKHEAAEATGDKTSDLVSALDGLPASVKSKAISAIVKADPAAMRESADEIESLGYHDLAARLRLRADVLSA